MKLHNEEFQNLYSSPNCDQTKYDEIGGICTVSAS
jgi:hypothetical protein